MNTPHTATSSKQSISSAQGRSVLVFGEVLADVFPDRSILGGAPFNVACHLQAFGLNPLMITRLGNDALCAEVLGAMNKMGMNTLGVQLDECYPTGQVIVHIEGKSHRFEILPMQAYDYINSALALSATSDINPDLIYFGTMAQRGDTSRHALNSLMNASNSKRFLDINLRAPWYDTETLRRSLEQANLVKINDDELDELSILFGLTGADAHACGRSLLQRFDLEQLTVTCGENGAWQVARDGSVTSLGSQYKVANPVDTVGAGDGFAAVSIIGALLDWPVALRLERANAFAAALCGIRGAIPEQADFYRPYAEEWQL